MVWNSWLPGTEVAIVDMEEEQDETFLKADRLNKITQRIGFALLQLQELEGVAATYFVLLTNAKRGMGIDAGDILVAKAKNKTGSRNTKTVA